MTETQTEALDPTAAAALEVRDWLRTLPLEGRARVLSAVLDTRNAALFTSERVAAVYELTRQPGATYKSVAELLGQSVNTINKAVSAHGRNVRAAQAAGEPEPAAEVAAEHTCNPDRPGKPLPFGRRAPEGECPRCDQLRAGAEPRTWSPSAADADNERAAAIRAHFASDDHKAGIGCGGLVCTFGDL